MRPISRRQWIGLILANTSVMGAGCGTILYPERRGQPAGMLDWKVVALDAVGLILFFVPGVIAFAVDFSNGTIYLPPDYQGLNQTDRQAASLVKVQAPDKRMTVATLEKIVSENTQRDIRLTPGRYETEKLDDIDDFWVTTDKLATI